MNQARRAWMFTIYNMEWKFQEKPEVRYLVYQKEKCPSTGKLHFQGYMELKDPTKVKRTGAQKLLGQLDCHVEPRKGSRDQARNYCMKEETREEGPYEFGSWIMGGQGTRNDLASIVAAIQDGNSIEEIATEHGEEFIKFSKGIKELKAIQDKKQRSGDREVVCHVLWGDAGCGKTRWAAQGDYYILQQTEGSLWFDGYDGQETLIIDDFYGWIKYYELLRILDRYPYKCNIKGSHTWANWKRVFITSNSHPSQWYTNVIEWTSDCEKTAAFKRRLTYIMQCRFTVMGSAFTCEKTAHRLLFDREFNKVDEIVYE